jgi:hypothetical protein
MADAVVRFGGNLHIARTECTETALQKHHLHVVEAIVTGRREWTREIGV